MRFKSWRFVSAGGGLLALVAALSGPEPSLSFTAVTVSALKAFLVPSQSAVAVSADGHFPSFLDHSVSNLLLFTFGVYLLSIVANEQFLAIQSVERQGM